MTYSYLLQGIVALPVVFLIDGNGTIRDSWAYNQLDTTTIERNDLSSALDRLLAPASQSEITTSALR
jgi:hypothetical protein